MFTGIIKKISTVTSVNITAGGMTIVVNKPARWKVRVGDSITVNGVCSTVKKTGGGLLFEYMPESLIRSNLKELKKGVRVNLEQSLTPSDRLDGHLVQGHVDTVGHIAAMAREGNSYIFKITFPRPSARLVAEKGSVAIDGISLTVVAVGSNFLTIKIIPYTWSETNLRDKRVGSTVNIEWDVLMKYVARLLSTKKYKQSLKLRRRSQ